MLRRLDTALMNELYMIDHYLVRKESKQSSLDVCQGIVLSAFWLDLISKDDYTTISGILDAKRMRLE